MDCQILILYFSRHGSTKQLARQIARGVESTPQCQAILRTVEELSPHSHSPPSDPIVTLEELKTCDGLAFGSPVWFGNMAAPLKHFWDQTTSLWVSGDLIDKPACVFTSSSSMHGGQETTLQSMMTFIASRDDGFGHSLFRARVTHYAVRRHSVWRQQCRP